jgi:hypothetical protein
MKRKILICFLLVTANVNSFAQKDFPKLSGPYLGQKPPGMTPKIFALTGKGVYLLEMKFYMKQKL